MTRQGADLKKRTDDLKRLLRQDYKSKVILERGTKHTKVIRKSDGKVITTIADTPSSYRSIKNCVAQLRKANVFKTPPLEFQLQRITMSWEDREEGLGVLQALGWAPGQVGRGGGGLRRFGELMQEATLRAHLDDKPLARDAYTGPIRIGIINGQHVDALTLDKLLVAIEWAKEKLGSKYHEYVPPGEDEPKEPVEELVAEVAPAEVPQAEPEVVYEQVGPLYQRNGKVNADSLHLRILAAILDPNTSREEAIELSVEVADLESH